MQFPTIKNYSMINPSPRNQNQQQYITQIYRLNTSNIAQPQQIYQYKNIVQTQNIQKYNTHLSQSSDDENSNLDPAIVIKLIKENQELKIKIQEKEKQMQSLEEQLRQYEQ